MSEALAILARLVTLGRMDSDIASRDLQRLLGVARTALSDLAKRDAVRAMNESSSNYPSRNQLLAGLSSPDLALLQQDLEPVSLRVRQVLESPNKPIEHSYFIERGLASIVAGNGHKRLEVGLIGREGMTGLPIVLGNDRSPTKTSSRLAEREAHLCR